MWGAVHGLGGWCWLIGSRLGCLLPAVGKLAIKSCAPRNFVLKGDKMSKIAVSAVTFRDDLYPRIEKQQAKVRTTVTYGVMCPDVCPANWKDTVLGELEDGMLYPHGTVAAHFYRLQQEHDANARNGRETAIIYLIREGLTGPVKIGTAQNIEQRLSALQTGNPRELHLIGILPEGHKQEQELHTQFASCHIRGEWFALNTSEVKELLNNGS